MPTPPWHGHLLRGITEVSRKLRAAERGGHLLRFDLHANRCMCRAKQLRLGGVCFQHFTALWISRTVKIGSIYSPMGKFYPLGAET
jgi:hypothetical protein